MNFKKTLVASILCAATVMGANQSANATAYATAVEQLSDMVLTSNTTLATVKLNDFNQIGGTNDGSASVNLNGAHAGTSATSNVTSGGSVTLTPVPALGSGYPVTPPFNADPPPVTVTNTYAVGNAALTGSIIDVTNGAGPSPLAVASTIAEASLASAGVGDAHSQMGVTSTFNFVANSALAGGVTLTFNYLAYVAVQLSADEIIPGFVSATNKWIITLSGRTTGDVAISGSTAPLNQAISMNALPGLNGITTKGSTSVAGPLTFVTGALVAGETYDFTITQNSDVNVVSGVSVPEPTSLFLIGLGMLGVAWSAKRKTADSLTA